MKEQNSSPASTDGEDDILQQIAKEELGETDLAKEEGIVAIKNWISTQDNQAYTQLDDLSILWFLRASKYDIERTKSYLDNFYSFRNRVTEWYEDRDPLKPELLDLLELGTFLPLPGRDAEGCKVVIIRATIHNAYKQKIDDVFKVMNMLVDLMCLQEETISIGGVVAIIDLQGVGMGHAMQMTPGLIKKAVNSWQDVNPIRVKGMHYINCPYNINVVMNVFKAFMKEKLKQRLHFHRGDGKTVLNDFVPVDNLPIEYGGRGLSIASLTEEWKNCAIANRDWFMNTSNHGPFSRET